MCSIGADGTPLLYHYVRGRWMLCENRHSFAHDDDARQMCLLLGLETSGRDAIETRMKPAQQYPHRNVCVVCRHVMSSTCVCAPERALLPVHQLNLRATLSPASIWEVVSTTYTRVSLP